MKLYQNPIFRLRGLRNLISKIYYDKLRPFCFYIFQVLVWVIIPSLRDSTIIYTNNVIRLIIYFQYIPRLLLISPPLSQVVKAAGVVTNAPWAGAAFNMAHFLLASHVSKRDTHLTSFSSKQNTEHSNPICGSGQSPIGINLAVKLFSFLFNFLLVVLSNCVTLIISLFGNYPSPAV